MRQPFAQPPQYHRHDLRPPLRDNLLAMLASLSGRFPAGEPIPYYTSLLHSKTTTPIAFPWGKVSPEATEGGNSREPTNAPPHLLQSTFSKEQAAGRRRRKNMAEEHHPQV